MKTHEHLKGSNWLRSLWRMLCAVLLITLLASVLQISDAGAQDRVVSRDLGGALTKVDAPADARAELAKAESALIDARQKQQVAQKSLGDARSNLKASQSGLAVAQDDLVRLNAELTAASGAVESQANAVSEAKAAVAAASHRVVAATKASANAQTAVEQQARYVADLSNATPNLDKANVNLALAQRTLSERLAIARNADAESTKAQQVALQADADVALAKAAAPTPEAISKAEAAVVAATTDLRTSQDRLADAVAKGAKDTKDLQAAVTRTEGLLIAAQNTRTEMAAAAERLVAAERNLETASKQAQVQAGAALDANASAKLASQELAKAERAVVEAEASAVPLDEAQTRLTVLQSEAAEARAAVVAAENEMVLAQQRVELAQDSLTSETGARDKLVTRAGELTKAIETAKKTIAEAPAKIASLDKQAVAAAEVVKSAEASVATLAVKVRELEGVLTETTVNRTAVVGSKLAPIARIVDSNPVRVAVTDGAVPLGAKLAEDASFTGAPSKAGEAVTRVMVTDTVTNERELRTINWTITQKPALETSVDRTAVLGSELPTIEPIFPESLTTVELIEGELPAGVKLAADGSFSGLASTTGKFQATVMVTDVPTGDRELRTVTWTVAEKPAAKTTVDRTSVAGDGLGPITRIDAENPITVAIVDGELPRGVKLGLDGKLLGAPQKACEAMTKVLITDSVTGDREIRTINWTITPKAVVEMTTDRSGVRGSGLAPIGRIVADNPVRVELLEGALPDGVKMAEDGGLRGAPTKVGETTSKVLITDVVTGDREERTITWTINEKDPVKTAEQHSAPRGSELAPIAAVEGENAVRVEMLDGELPEGINLSADGNLDGKATKVGDYTATVMVIDTETGDREERSITWSITPKDIVSTTEAHTSVRDAELDAIAPIDAKNPVTVSLLEGQLPNGVRLGDNGALDGAATKVGDYTAIIMVTDTVTTDREQRTITWTIDEKAPVNTTEAHTAVREAELAPIAPIADDNPVTVELLDGELPDGIELDEDGSLDGAATKVGNYTATIMVTDTKTGDREQRTITWTITTKDIVKTSTERAGVRDAKLARIAPIADANPVTVELLDGELPEGVELDDDGALTGAPTTVGDTTSTVLVTDTVTTDRHERTITWTIIDKDAVEKSVDASTTRTGTFASIAPVYGDGGVTVELLEGELPTGISMDDDGTFTGDATEVGEYAAKIMVTDTATSDRELRTYTWIVNPKPTVKSTHDFSAVREATLAPLAAFDDQNPISAELVEGALPDGVKLAKDGELDGTANRTGDYTATLLVTDTVTLDSELRSITWRIAPKPISGSIEQHEATRKVALPAVQRIADNPIAASVTAGSLPAGVELREDGTMTGSPDQAGTYRYTVLVTDAVTGDRESRAVSLTVSEKEATEISEVMAATRKEALAPLKRIAAENPVVAELTAGSLPIGIDLMPDGSFAGTPDHAGTFNAMIMVTDEVTAERELRSVSFVVADKDATITNSQRTADIGDSIGDLEPIKAGNGVTAELVGGSLPNGITLASDGSFNGKTASAGAYSAAIMVTDNETAERELRTVNITVLPAPDTKATSRTAKVGAAIAPLARVASSNPITAELVSGTLPPGVSLSSTGAFEGTSTTAGSWTVDIMVTDTTTGNRELRTVSFQLNAAPAATRVTYSGTTYSGAAGTFTTGSTGSTSTPRDAGSTSTWSTTAPSAAQARTTGTSIFGEAPDLLAFTGTSTTRLAGVGGALILVGAMALVASKRKDDDET